MLINNAESAAFSCSKYYKSMEKNEKVDYLTVIDQVVVAFVRSPNSLVMKVLADNQKIQEYKFAEKHLFDSPSCKVVEASSSKYLFLSLYGKKDISMYIFTLNQEELTLYKTIAFNFNHFIEYSEFDSKGKRLLAYSLNNNTVQIW